MVNRLYSPSTQSKIQYFINLSENVHNFYNFIPKHLEVRYIFTTFSYGTISIL